LGLVFEPIGIDLALYFGPCSVTFWTLKPIKMLEVHLEQSRHQVTQDT